MNATNPESHSAERVGEISNAHVLVARLMWMMLGPIGLLFLVGAIVTGGDGWFTVWNLAYGVVVALMIGGRWVEHRSGTAMTVMGNPATLEHSRRYIRALLPIAGGVWGAANVLGNHILI